MPANGLSLTVLIRCQPDHLSFLGCLLEFTYHLLLIGRYFIYGFKCIYVNTQVFLFQVTDMSVA